MFSKASLMTAAFLVLVGFAAFPGTGPDIAGMSPGQNRAAVPAPSASDSPLYAPHFMPLNPEVADVYTSAGQKVPLQMTEARFAEREDLTINQPPRRELPLDATVKALVLLVEFTDNPPGGPTARFSPGVWDSMLFGDYYVRGGLDTTTTKTLKRFYDEVSFGTVDIVTLDLPSAVGWLTAPNNYTYYCDDDGIHDNGFGPYPNNVQRLVMDAVIAADPVVDFSEYASGGWVENLFVVHSGSGAEWSGGPILIWSHMWSIATGDGWGNTPPALFVDGVRVGDYSMEPECGGDTVGEAGPPMTPMLPTCGVYCHEFGHVLGLPDEYDYGYESSGTGRVSLMSGGSWNRIPDVYPDCAGNSPAHPSAWGAAYLGFVTPTEVTVNTTGITIPPIEQTGTNAVYKLTYPGTSGKEYWLFENRQQIGFDAGFIGMTSDAHGLVVYHVDENVMDRNFWRPNEAECVSGGVYQGETNCDCASLPPNPSNGEKWYGLSVEQADGDYGLERGTSGGYWQDFYSSVTGATTFDDTSSPNTTSYYSHYSCDAYAAARNIQEIGLNITLDLTPDTSVPSVTLNTPNGGESYQGGSLETIEWEATDDFGELTMDLYLSTDGGISAPYVLGTGLSNTGWSECNIPRLDSDNCLVKIVARDAAQNEAIDWSDSPFEIHTPVPAMSWPGIIFLCVGIAAVAFLLMLRRRRKI